MNNPSQTRGTILVAEDDPAGMRLMRLILERSKFAVLEANSVKRAQDLIQEVGIHTIHCVLADYRMPHETGLDLLNWVQSRDPNLSTIIITAEGSPDLIQHSMRGGAIDFIEKPIGRSQLENAVTRAVNSTARMRRLETAQRGVNAVGKLDSLLKPSRALKDDKRINFMTLPKHEVGGDFLDIFPNGTDGFSFVLGDVSGHDVRAAFVSSYFQGMSRGLTYKGADIAEIVPLFNRILNDQWNSMAVKPDEKAVPIATSLSLCAGNVSLEKQTLRIMTCGFPHPCYMDEAGKLQMIGEFSAPLGWFSDVSAEVLEISTKDMSYLYLATDGLHDEASDIGIDAFSLIYRLINAKEEEARKLVPNARDDIFLMRINMNPEPSNLEPIIQHNYAGSEHEAIDDLQNVWRRSLTFALPSLSESRAYDVLLCCREAVLNALVHGCDQSPEKSCSFQVNYDKGQQTLHVRIDDPGHGHDFNLDDRIDNIPKFTGEQMGLAIISRLSDSYEVENNGSTVKFSFSIRDKEQ